MFFQRTANPWRRKYRHSEIAAAGVPINGVDARQQLCLFHSREGGGHLTYSARILILPDHRLNAHLNQGWHERLFSRLSAV